MQWGIEAAVQRQFQHGDVGFGVDHFQRYEYTMVQATGRIQRGLESRCAQAPGHGRSERRRTGYVVAQLVGVRWKAVVVEHQWRFSGSGERESLRFPMARYDQDGERA